MTATIATPEARPISRSVVPGAALIAVTFGLARYGYGLLLPEMTTSLGLSPTAAGLISSGAYLSYLAANLAVVVIGDRYGPRAAIGLAGIAAVVGMVLVATATGIPALALGVLVAGAAAGFAFPPYAEVVARQVDPARRDLAWSAISSGSGWGVAIAGPVAVVAGDRWRVVWLVFVVLAVLVGVTATATAPGPSGTVSRHRPQLSWTWFVCPRSRPLLCSAVLVGAGSAVWWTFSVEAMRSAGLDATAARVVYAVSGVAGIAASASGALFARIGLRTGYLGGVVLLGGAEAALAGTASDTIPTVVAGALFGVLYPTVIAAHGIWSARVFPAHPAAGLAAVSTALTLGTLTGPVGAGRIIAAVGYPGALISAGAAVLLAAPFCPAGRRRRERLAAHRCRAAPVRV